MGFPGNSFLSRLRHLRGPFVLAAAFTLPLNTAHAGFFDFLFGPPPAAQSPAPAYPGGMTPRWRGEPHFHQHRSRAVFSRGGGASKTVVLHHPKHLAVVEKTHHSHKSLPHAPAGLMDDDSLKDGDAVMTQRGIRVFTGSSGDHHKPEEFARLSDIKGLSKSARTSLAAIDANRSEAGQRQHDIVTGRSAAESQIAAGTMITDPKGRQIRYVGP